MEMSWCPECRQSTSGRCFKHINGYSFSGAAKQHPELFETHIGIVNVNININIGTGEYHSPMLLRGRVVRMCVLCRKESLFTVCLPYGSEFEEEHVCNVCLHEHLDPVIREKVKCETND